MKKKWIFLTGALLLVAGIVTTVYAQRGGRFQGRGPGGLFEKLDLTDAQQEQLQAMHQKLRAEMRSTWESNEPPDPEAMQAIRAAHFEQLKSVLTEEQLAKLEDLKATFGADGRGFLGGMRGRTGGKVGFGWGLGPGHWGRGQAGWGPGPGAMMEHRGGIRGHGPGGTRGHGMWGGPEGKPGPGARRSGDVFTELDLSDEQKAKLKELRGEHREEVEELRSKHREEMEKVLTKEQRKELEELKDEAFYGGGRKGVWKGKRRVGR